MKKNLITTMLFIAAISASAQTRQLFDFGWQFTHNGTTQTVDLPHDWDIFEGPNSGKGATGTGGGVLGARAFDDAEIRKVCQMKEAGFNLIRTSHNPTTRAFLDACDSIGMLVIDEAFDGWRTQKNPYDYSTVIDS